ncbi:pentatricopeptide repeat-containing protein At1g62720-like [Lotus japonicus]|uniref:pentatricopeptide repeat-containing protein At1g62720-like n=1 Tax=Lotus japonicus TaxID=34305 RepID=UPI002590E126|nr:pentatricopeptide repeat-containing protein At1g62720-like [Lotus japonicus]
MKWKGLSVDERTYSSVIGWFCDQDDIDSAHTLLSKMIVKGFSPSVATYNRLVFAYCRQDSVDEAVGILRAMAERGEFTKAFHLHDEMILKGFLPDFVTGFSPAIVTYNALIHGLCFLDRVEEALEILRGMPEMGLSPDAVCYSTVISGFCQIGELGKAYELKIETEEKAIWWLDKDTYDSLMASLSYEDTYSSVMNDYSAKGNMERAFQFFDDMSHNDYLSSYDAYSVFIVRNFDQWKTQTETEHVKTSRQQTKQETINAT